jgi:PadR family transcriptional regulator PadR
MYELTKNEELVLLSIWKLKGNAYGVTIRESIKKITRRTLNFGSLYNTLYLLARKGLIESRESEPLSQQGGRRKVLYTLTREGERALSEAQRMHKRVWGDVPDFALEKRK